MSVDVNFKWVRKLRFISPHTRNHPHSPHLPPSSFARLVSPPTMSDKNRSAKQTCQDVIHFFFVLFFFFLLICSQEDFCQFWNLGPCSWQGGTPWHRGMWVWRRHRCPLVQGCEKHTQKNEFSITKAAALFFLQEFSWDVRGLLWVALLWFIGARRNAWYISRIESRNERGVLSPPLPWPREPTVCVLRWAKDPHKILSSTLVKKRELKDTLSCKNLSSLLMFVRQREFSELHNMRAAGLSRKSHQKIHPIHRFVNKQKAERNIPPPPRGHVTLSGKLMETPSCIIPSLPLLVEVFRAIIVIIIIAFTRRVGPLRSGMPPRYVL